MPFTFVEVMKTEGGADFPAGDYAYVPDREAPSTWKLRLTKTPGGVPDSGIVGAAIAALGKGFRGQKVDIPAEDLAKVKAKVRAAWKKANPDKETDEMPEAIQEAASGGSEFEEAARFQTLMRGLIRSAHAVASHEQTPAALRRRLSDLRATLTKSYADMADDDTAESTEAIGDTSHGRGEVFGTVEFREIALGLGQSVDDFQRSLQSAVNVAVAPGLSGAQPWIADVYEDRLVYSQAGGEYRLVPYTVGADGLVTLGTPADVERVTTYRPKPMLEAGKGAEMFREDGLLLEVEDE